MQRVGDLRSLAIERRVLDRHRGTGCDHPGQLEIRLFEHPAGLCGYERQRPESLAADAHRHDQRGAEAHGAEQLQMPVVERSLDEHFVRYLRIQQRLARANHATHSLLRVKTLRSVLPELLGQCQPTGIDVRHSHRLAISVLVNEVDGAPVGDVWHGQLGHVLERLLVIQRGSQHVAGVGQEGTLLLGPLLLGDVLDHHDCRLHLAGLVHQRRRLEQVPALNAGVAINRSDQQRFGGLFAGQ